MIPEMGVQKYKDVEVRFANYVSFILNYPMKMK